MKGKVPKKLQKALSIGEMYEIGGCTFAVTSVRVIPDDPFIADVEITLRMLSSTPLKQTQLILMRETKELRKDPRP